MTKRTKILIGGGAVLAAAAAAAAFLLTPRRTVTTTSAEAYQEYLLGREDYLRWYFREARGHYESALEKDPHFVMAMVELVNLEYKASHVVNRPLLDRAQKDREHVTRRERLALDLTRAFAADKPAEAL